MRATVHYNAATKQPNSSPSVAWNRQEVDSEKEQNESLHLGKPFPKPSTAGSGDDKPTPPTPISFDFSKLPIFPPQQARIQPKLKINAPGDRYELEADRVAEQVMRMPPAHVQRKTQWSPSTLPNPFAIQRKCDACAKEEEEEEETLQAKSAWNTGGVVPPTIAQQIQSSRGNGQMMDMGTRSFMEARFGTDFGGVRIHDDNNATLLNQRLQAKAFTLGSDVYFNQGQYSPGGGDGRRLLAHELTHVVQQGKSDATPQFNATAIGSQPLIQRKADPGTSSDYAFYGPPIPNKAPNSTSTNNVSNQPELTEFVGRFINKAGKISSDAKNFKDAVTTGMNIRSKPLPEKDLVIGKIKYGESVYIKASDNTEGWYYVVSFGGIAGWINQAFVANDMPGVNANLHHVQLGENLGDVLKKEYTGKYNIKAGDDYRAISSAFVIANKDRKGVKIDTSKFKKSFDENFWTNLVDPWNLVNRAIYQSVEIVAGTNVWLPDIVFIDGLKKAGFVSTRPDFVNDLADVGRGIGGFVAGIFEGFFGAIVDALEGLWEIAKGILDTIGKIFTGELFSDIADIYDEITNLTWDKVLEIAKKLLSSVVEGINEFESNWSHPDVYKRWNFRGKIVGNIILEVVLAIFTAGAGNALKWAGRLGKVAPKLASIITKALNKVDDVLPAKFKKKGKGHEDKLDDSLDENTDSNAVEKQKALVFAKTIAETHDAKDSSIATLKASLEVVKQKFRVVKGFEVELKAQPGHYEVWMIASRHKVDEDYTPKSDLAARVLAKIHLYPKIIDKRTGKQIQLPHVDRVVPKHERVKWDAVSRLDFIKEWHDLGYERPIGGWDKYDIHHIKPREYGGNNDFWNLVPVERTTHQKELNAFWREFGDL